MTPSEYQEHALRTCGQFATKQDQLLFAASLASAEAGELLNQVIKVAYQGHPLDSVHRAKIVEEAGDTLWSLCVTLAAIGVTPEECMAANRAKLDVRYPNGTFSPADSIARLDVVEDREAEELFALARQVMGDTE